MRTRLATLAARVEAGRAPGGRAARLAGAWEESLPRQAYVERVERAKEHIRAGDVFQVVLSRRWSAPVEGDTFSIYRALRRVSPSPYQYYLRTPRRGRSSAPRPSASCGPADDGRSRRSRSPGRAGAGATPEEDLALARELLADDEGAGRARDARRPRAERPRAGRRARDGEGAATSSPSSASPTSCTSRRASPGVSPTGRTPSTPSPRRFPAGTLTGAPKIRAMEIIEELEPVRRGRLRRRGRLPRLRGPPRHGDRDPDGGRQGRRPPRAGGCRHRRRLASRGRGGRVREQGLRALMRAVDAAKEYEP